MNKEGLHKKNFREEAIKKEERALKAKGRKEVNPWWGFSLFGLVGWTVVGPILIGIFLGFWLEHRYGPGHPWILGMLFTGLFVGIILALALVGKELFKNKDD